MQGYYTFDETIFRDQAQKDGITHISTGVAILRDGKILMARRAAEDFLGGIYELPGGGVDEGESITGGAIREVKEETGLTVSKVITTFQGFDYSTDRKPAVRQVNFLIEAAPGEVVLDPNEHDEYVWVDESNVADTEMTDNMRTCVADALKLIK
ncbi:MAG TPA: NUDIX hydrolase [Candidatus Saccharimonadales bacterium]|jgi:8-oxo-dGTP diphosphatase